MKSRGRFRARLARLDRTLPPARPSKDPSPFALDPGIVLDLIPDVKRLSDLAWRESHFSGQAGTLNSGEIEELAKLRAELPVRLQIIAPAMVGYGVAEQRRDQELFGLSRLFYGPLSEHEEAQARIRITFFALSPEGLGRARLGKLQDHYWPTPAEKAELAHLEAAYPEVPWDESTWEGRRQGAWARAKKEEIENTRQRHRERAKTNPRFRCE